MQRLSKKVVLVTGGSRGMGAAISKRLASEGALVVLTYHRSVERAAALVQEIRGAGGQAIAIAADNADPDQVKAAVERTVKEFGGLDILVNNAGIYVGKDFRDHTMEDYEQVMAVNVRAVYAAALAAVQYIPEGGRIITIGSNMADYASRPQTTLYTMSKSALQGFTRGLARDLGSRKITVNLVQPGPIDTEMNPADGPHADGQRSKSTLGQYGTVEDVAGLVAYLASEEGRYITGAALTIDGGINA
jgi:3-oxoacyl-[acyl-carrier protein] reductase